MNSEDNQTESAPIAQVTRDSATTEPGKAKKLLGMGGTFLTVVVLTGLLWVWADQSQLIEQEISLSFILATEAKSNLILLSVDEGSGPVATDAATNGQRIRANVVFEATRSRLRELQNDLQNGKLELWAYLSGSTYWPGKHEIQVVNLLNANDALTDRGVTATQADPSEIAVVLDEWVVRKKVKLAVADTPETQRFEAYISPGEIDVEVPSSFKDRQIEALSVDLGQIPEKITPGLEISGTVATEFEGMPVRPKKTKVTVTLQPTEQSSAVLGPLQIEASLPPDMIGKYDLKFENEASKVVEVKVVGPASELNKLKAAPQEKVWAYIRLGTKHTKATEAYYPVKVEFEFIDVRGIELAEEQKSVKVRLEKKLSE